MYIYTASIYSILREDNESERERVERIRRTLHPETFAPSKPAKNRERAPKHIKQNERLVTGDWVFNREYGVLCWNGEKWIPLRSIEYKVFSNEFGYCF